MENIRHKDARPMMDLIAKKIFSDTEITAEFIRDILELPVESVKILEGTQIHVTTGKILPDFTTQVDVLAELNDKTQVVIEIQVAMQVDFIKRLWLYICEQVSQNLDEYKKAGIETHYLSQELIPVYAVAITEENYFEDDRAIHNFSLRDSETKEELKVRVKGIEEKRSLVQIAFLELKKYKPEMKVSYNKVRWMELFGNKPFTHQPGNIITKADRILDVKEWNKEDKAMFDEYIRAWDGWNAHLAYVKEAKEQALEQGIEQGLQRGREEGIEEGRVGTLIDLVKKGVITKGYACEELGISEQEFEKYL
ncbi:Rpn family recombination-promoting nuclease/putative transposase [Gemella haemolysans]|uniref:Rpn family recombination-promoting nuclease/putative transposase n=1 Tax=Gemella haemolysans TaxID=1379 RepID=UPI0019569FE2|nr:Rpn family recombination-promoting nuclease/putative transposase [Gemella haemolysans]VTX78643.1 PD-(D/E)XK nuclease family transposase [Gemella haemolysans]